MVPKEIDPIESAVGDIPEHAKRIAVAKVQYSGQERDFYLFDTPLGHVTFQEIMSGKSYPVLNCIGDVRTVVDVGANVGAATIFFAVQYPEAQILAFEPAPYSYRLLVKNTEGLSQIRTFNVGLFDTDGTAPLYLGQQDSATNSIGACGLNTSDSVTVELRNARTALVEQGFRSIDILKLDAEGCEVPILRALGPLRPEIGVLFLEYHRADDRLEIDRLLAPTHVLVQGQIMAPHRGELCYVARQRLAENAEVDRLKICVDATGGSLQLR